MICEKTKCAGCQACYNICPKKAIKMKEDKEGFLYPKINKKLCINCNLCKKICPIRNNKEEKGINVKKAYAAVNKEENSVINSSSGGIFTILAEIFIKSGNYVSGCIFDNNINAVHIVTNRMDEIIKMRKSKYVQSDIKDAYKIIKDKLLQGNMVLFSGTPCQVDGLKSYLGKDYENLYMIDIICHGVPSPKILQNHIKWLEDKYGKLNKIDFRSKTLKDNNIQILKYEFEKKTKKIRNYMLDPYYNAFYNALDYRESCYNCKYANCHRVGDITLGDYWGVEKYHPKLQNKKGTSLILVNTEKGKELFEKIIKERVNYEETNLENARLKNNNLNHPVKREKIRDEIYVQMNNNGYGYIVDKYLRPKNYWIIKLKSLIPMRFKQNSIRIINKLLKK